MTLKERYQKCLATPYKRELPPTPAQSFINECCEVTKKSELAVRRWLSDSKTTAVPDALVQEVLAKHFKTTPDELFPRQ